MKLLVVLAVFALCAGAFAEIEAEEVDVVTPEPEAVTCPQTLIDLYRASRNDCIDEIRANLTAIRSQASDATTTEDPTSDNDNSEEDIEVIERCAEEERDEEGDAQNNGHVEDNRSRRSNGQRRQRARGRNVRWSHRRKQFFRQFKSCLVNKIKDNSIVAELKTTCVANCAAVNATKRESKENKCVLKKLKQRCPDIVPARTPRVHRRNRHNNVSHHRN